MISMKSLSRFFSRYDFSFLAAGACIFVVGLLNLYSATSSSENLVSIPLKQLIYFCTFCVFAVGVSLIRPKTYFSLSFAIYAINLILLILVLVLGQKGMGAQRWLALGPVRIQPSEFMKLSLILVLARWFAKDGPDQPLNLKSLVAPGILALVPMLLVAKQPDLGTSLLYLLILSFMAFYRRLSFKTILGFIAAGVAASVLAYHFALKDYQKRRIKTFINPQYDARGAGYNALQSRVAIGSGRFLGKGFKESTQASLNFLPENHTDFVFSIFSEEHGFFGSLVLIGIWIIFFFRMVWLAINSRHMFDSLLCIGVLSLFFWHTFINMGMVMGLLPIVGLPLPLMTYGGSSLLTFCVAMGVLTSVSNRRKVF